MNYEKGFSNYIEAIQKDRDDILQQHHDDGERFENRVICVAAIPHARVCPVSYPLAEGIEHKAYKSLKWLLEHGADTSLANPREKVSSTVLAVRSNDEQILRLFGIRKKKGVKNLFKKLGIEKKTKSEKKRHLREMKNHI